MPSDHGESRGIFAGKIEASKEPDRWTFAELRVLKGGNAGSPRLALAFDKAEDAKRARDFLRSSLGSEAVLFQGRFWGTEPGLLLVQNVWMRLKLVGGAEWQITGYAPQMRNTFAGTADKLIEMADYLLHDDKADVPVSAGTKWQSRVRVAPIPRPITGIASLAYGPGRAARLFVASPSGDRVFAFNEERNAFEDLTRASGLDTASRAFAFLDLNGDGRTDLVSWDGARLKVRLGRAKLPLSHLGREDGGFARLPGAKETAWRGECAALAAVSPRQDGSPGLLLSAGWPHLLAWKADGWSVSPLPGDKARYGSAEPGVSCVVADWDGDGYADVLQLRPKESLLWKGIPRGFEEPQPCGVKNGGSPARWCVGDFDTDGRLDLVVSGREASELWENAGSCRFRPVIQYAGSLAIRGEPGAADCLATDVNHDGRPDVALLYESGAFFYHFNRGYRCMGEEGELKLDAERPTAAPKGAAGSVRAAVGDFSGDGSLDLAVVFAAGDLFCFFNGLTEPPGLWIRLPRGCTGPVTVSVWQGAVRPCCVGTYRVEGHSPPTYASLRRAGPCVLKWRWPGGPPRALDAKDGAEAVLPRD